VAGAREIRRRDNVPVVSWLVLRGRCRDCSAPISARYPLVEATTAVVFALVAWRFGPSWELPAYLWLAAIGIALVLIDLDVHRLPDAIVLPSYPVVIGLLALAGLNPGGEADWGALLRALAGGAILFVAYFLMAVAYPGGMGFGDVKLAGVLGLGLGWLGWGALVVGGFSAFLLGGLFSVALLLLRRAGRRSGIPFGPWMVLGAAVGVAVGEQVWRAYLGLIL
jgi:leader peptidase (prepilin peptidase) / N-methyltransferase